MTETAESSSPPPASPKPYWLYRVAAWVGIIAGIVFIVSTIFFAGFFVSDHGWRGHHRHHGPCMMHPHGPGPGSGMMGPEFAPPGPPGPGNGPAGPGNGPAGPGGPGHLPPPPAPPRP